MKIHQYNEMMRWLTRPKEDPSIKQLAASLPYGTQETYGAPEQIDMPNIQDIIREEGIQVGPQVKDGGRVQYKPGGLVEPGVTHYGRLGPKPEPLNAEQLEVMKKMYKVETEAEAIEKFGKKKWYSKKAKIRAGIFTGTGSGQLGTIRRDPSTEWLKFSQDPKFEEFFTQQIKMASDKAETKALRDLKKVMNKYKLTAESPVQDIFEKFVLENHNALSQAKDSLISGRSFHKTVTDQFNVFKRNYGTMSIREFTEALPAMKGYKNPIDTFTKLKTYSKYTDESLAKMDPGSAAYSSKVNAQKQGRIFMQALKNHGIEVIEHPAEAKYRGKFPGEKRYVGEVRIKATPEQLVSFNDSNYWEDVYKTSKEYKAKITKLSKADPMYKLGKYGEHLGNLNKLQKHLNNVVDSKTFEELVKWVDENPKLKDMVEAHFNRSTLEMETRPLREMSEGELRQRVRFQKDHIRGRGTVGYDKVSNKILDGIGVEFPKNYHIIPGSMNFPTKFNVENAVREFPHETEKIKKLEEWFKKRDLSFWDQNTKTYRGAVPKATSAYTSHLGIEIEKLLKSEEVFPEWHKRAGHPIVEDPNLWAKIEKTNLAMGPESKGLLKGAAAKFPKTTAVLKSIFETKTPLGAAFWALEAPLIMLQGTYNRYANERDFKAGLKRAGMPDEAIEQLGEVYGQELADIGQVGLESWAVDQPDTFETRKQITEEMAKGKPHFETRQAGPLMMKDFGAIKTGERKIQDYEEQLKQYEIEKRTREAYEKYQGRRTGGRVPFIKGKIVKGVDEGRRAFMKWLAGITGAGIAAGTGLLKWGAKKGAGKTVIKAGDHIVQGTQGMPDWFIPLINRITKEGDDVTKKLGTKEREIVHTKKITEGEEVTVYQDLDTGNVRVDYDSPYNMGEGAVGPVSLEYRAGEVITEGKHAGKKTKPEFEAVEPEPVSHTMGPDDYAIEWDGANVVGRAEDLMSDTNKLKQFATKKKPTMGEIVESSKKKKAVQKVHENESDYIVSKQGEGEWDDYLPDIDDMDY